MRYRDIIAAALVVLFCLLSCTDEAECGSKSAALDINATIHSTVIAKETFIQDDCIGVYLVSYNNGTPGTLGDINQTTAVNVEYAFDTSGYWYSKDGTDIFLDEEPSDLYAYHPYDEEMSRQPGKTNLSAYPFSVKTDQQTDGGETSDFLWAKVPGLSANNFTAPIVFQHLMCRCEINIRLAEGLETTNTPELRVHNIRTSCSINLRNGRVTAGTETGIVTPEVNIITTPGYDYTYDAILIPQALSSGTPFLTINLGGETYMYQLPSDFSMVAQESYQFNLVAGSPTTRFENTFTIERITDNI